MSFVNFNNKSELNQLGYTKTMVYAALLEAETKNVSKAKKMIADLKEEVTLNEALALFSNKLTAMSTLNSVAANYQPLLEGQFSWLTHDRGEQIGSERENTIDVWMFDNQGNMWYEKSYDGYGKFGNMDYYDLVAKMNGYSEEDLDIKVGKRNKIYRELREIGIALAFNELETRDKNGEVLFPALMSDPKGFNYKKHDFAEEAPHDPNQSWYQEPEYDEDEDYYESATNEAVFGVKDFNKILISYAIDTRADEIYIIKVDTVIKSGFPDVSKVPDKRFHGMFGMMLEDNWMKQYDKLPEVGDILPAPKKDKAFESKVNEGVMSDIDILAKEAKDFKSFVKEFKKAYGEAGDAKELESWLQSVYDNATMDESVAEATVTLDTTEPDAENLLKFIKKHKITMKPLNPNGGGDFDAYEYTGKRKDLETMISDIWGDKELIDSIKENTNVSEAYEVHYSDGVRAFKKFGNERQAIAFAKDLIKSRSGLQFVDVFKAGSGFHSTADTDAIVAFWGDGSYTDNVSKGDAKLAAKKINESEVNEARSINKIQKDWSKVTSDMKETVDKWKAAEEGELKTSLLAKLKSLTAQKHELEAELNAAVQLKDVDAELVGEAWVGPFQFTDKMSDDELKKMYDEAVSGYANWQKGFEHPKSDYKKAYQEIAKILKKRGVVVESVEVNEAGSVALKKGDIIKFEDGSSIYILGPKGNGYDYKDGREKGHHPKGWFDMMISSGKAVVESVETNEGNAFGAARAEAIAKGEKTFKVNGEEYDVESVDKEDKENSKEFVEEAKLTKAEKWMQLAEKLNRQLNEDLRADLKKFIKANQKELNELADADNWDAIHDMLRTEFDVKEGSKQEDELFTTFNFVF